MSQRLGLRESPHRERIIDEAADLFAAQGYHRTGIADIERAVQLGRGALYYHIGDKEALLFEIGLRAVGHLDTFVEELLDEPIEADEQIRRCVREMLHVSTEQSASVAVFAREHASLTGERRRVANAKRERFEAGWSAIFDHGETTGLFSPTTSLVRRGLLSMVSGTHVWFRPAHSVSSAELADQYSTTILVGVHANVGRR